MTTPVGSIQALLTQTEAAHGAYEATELKGVYDQDWPSWYAQYAVEHGIGDLLGRAVTTEELARFLADSWRELEAADPKPAESWPAYTAQQIATRL